MKPQPPGSVAAKPVRAHAIRRPSLILFLTLLTAYAYFHQGGNWNSSGRFAQVRAVVEAGEFQINRFVVYEIAESVPGRGQVRRVPLPEPYPKDLDLKRLNTWDVSLFEGRIYPNKPPGTSLLAVPAYGAVSALGKQLGLNPDGWLMLTVSFWLTTALSVGLIGALGGVLFFYISQHLFVEVRPSAHAAASLAFGLGTIYFTFSTTLFDHVPAAVAQLAAFGLVLEVCDNPDQPTRSAALKLAAAGAALGLAVVINYLSVMAVLLIGLYLVLRRGLRWALSFFALGGLPFVVFLAWFHTTSFGSLLATANSHQLERFVDDGTRLLGMFGTPDLHVLWRLLFSSYRGLFVFSPILLLSGLGFWWMFRERHRMLEGALFLALFSAFLGINASFNGWHGGATFGPRYLIPALPFLALPLALVFERLPRLATPVTIVSVVIVLLGTATSPLQISHRTIDNPLVDHVLPSFLGQHPVFRDPVAQNPVGPYDGNLQRFTLDSVAARWSSFNVGEALFPHSRASLLPLILALAVGSILLTRQSKQ